MKTLRNVTIASLAFLLLATNVPAQERPSFEAGPYLFNLSLMAGYRSISVDPYGETTNPVLAENRFYETGNYRGIGLNLNSFSLFGERTGKEGFFDQLFVNADGLGDPFTTASLRMRSFNSYDFKVSYRNSKYFLNRNDSIYTGLHKFDRTRQFLNASLDLNAGEDVVISAKFYNTGRTGRWTTTMSPFMVGGEEMAGPGGVVDGSFGSYARGNFYWMTSPLNDMTNEFSLGATLNVPDAHSDFTVGGGYRMFSQDWHPDPADNRSLTYYDSAGTINWAGVYAGFPNSPKKVAVSMVNPLYDFTWEESQESKTPFAFFEAVSRPIDDLSITANFRYENTDMTGELGGQYSGIMPQMTNTAIRKTAGPRNVADTTHAEFDNSIKSMIGSLSVTGTLMDGLNVTGLYRLTNTDLLSKGELHSNIGGTDTVTSQTYNSLVAAMFDNHVEYKTTNHFIEGFVNYMPIKGLSLRAGVQFDMRSPDYHRLVEGEPDSASNLNLSREMNGMTPFFSFWYKPIKEVKLSGRYSHTDVKVYNHGTTTEVDMPIRTTPKATDKYSFGVDVDPIEDLRINLHVAGQKGSSDFVNMIPTVVNAKLTDDVQSFGGSINYQFIEEAELRLATDYSKNDFVIPATWTRGQYIPNPYRVYGDSMTASVEQHTKDLYVDASLNTQPIKDLNVLVGFSMIKSEGGTYMTPNTIDSSGSGASRAKVFPDLVRVGGPYTWNLLHAQVSYDLTANIGVQVDFQMASQKEDKIENYVAVFNNYKVSIIRGNIYFKL